MRPKDNGCCWLVERVTEKRNEWSLLIIHSLRAIKSRKDKNIKFIFPAAFMCTLLYVEERLIFLLYFSNNSKDLWHFVVDERFPLFTVGLACLLSFKVHLLCLLGFHPKKNLILHWRMEAFVNTIALWNLCSCFWVSQFFLQFAFFSYP